MDNSLALKAADNIRILSAAMVEKAKSGHPGGAMGGADFIQLLYSEFLNYDPADPAWPHRDRFFLDPGHMSPMLYSILALCGFYSMEDLQGFRQWGSPTPGHPEIDRKRMVENTSGPLGQGHTMAVGAAIAERFLAARFGEWTAHKTYAFISDGGVQEEISQGAGRIAGYLGLSNLIMFYDSNDIQLSTECKAVTCEDTAKKYEAWGWRVRTIDGNDADQIRAALQAAVAEKEKPVLIIGKTVMGKGAVDAAGKSFERKTSTHGQPLSKAGADLAATIRNLGGDPAKPFQVFPEVAARYAEAKAKKAAAATARKEAEKAWAAKNPDLAAKLKTYLAGEVPAVDYRAIAHKEGLATRAASANVLHVFAEQVGNMIVASADLADSDRTEGFLKKTKPFTRGDFSGAFLHAGVSELTMGAIANGITLHGGVFVAVGTFFVFSDYMKPTTRIAALMEQPVKYIWTHDAFRVGEDGPTHQPVEQEAQARLLEHLRNHSGRRSMLVLRPADSAETSVAWKMAMENTTTPTALILSRQNIKDLPARPGSTRYEDALQATRGAYVVKAAEGRPSVVLVGNGSEVATLVAGAEELAKKGVRAQVVSVISEGLFRDQPAGYQQEVIPDGLPVFGLTAGLPVTLTGLVGLRGRVHGLEHFGHSAPAEVLDEKLGFTPAKVVAEVTKMLGGRCCSCCG